MKRGTKASSLSTLNGKQCLQICQNTSLEGSSCSILAEEDPNGSQQEGNEKRNWCDQDKGIQRDSSVSGTSDGSETLSKAEWNLLCTGHGNTPSEQAGQST